MTHKHIALGVALAATVGGAPTALAQDGAGAGAGDGAGTPVITDVEVPSLILDAADDDGAGAASDDIDLANVVQSAARGVTTVQEAPTIVTVITEDEIESRHPPTIVDLMESVPGYIDVGLIHSQFPQAAARGQIQAVQFLHDSVSMFDPFVNIPSQNHVQPLELIKRVELITGPGGVLWGANSLLGIANVITKDAEDVDGVEVGVTGGHGDGAREYLHGYVMAGKEGVIGRDSRLLVHGQFKSYDSGGVVMPQHIFSAPLPQPNSQVLFGPLTMADPARSFLFSAFAKLTVGKAQLRVFVPYYERNLGVGFPGIVVQEDLPEDARCGDAMPIDPADRCTDPLRAARANHIDIFDRYAVLEYRTRSESGKAGLSAKAYLVQFVRKFNQLQVLSPIEGLLEGGLAFNFDATTYRPGAAIDGDIELGALRALYGVEAFHEFAPDTIERSRQGAGIEATFIGPYNLERLPLACPVAPGEDGTVERIEGCPLTFAFPSSRTVMSAYVAPQYRPFKELVLDAGARVSVAPTSLGENGYAPQPTFGASAVYNFVPNWHLKLNLAQGFRPPVFNNLNSNGEAVQIDGKSDLEIETTDAFQAELNARLFKGQRRIRELNFRLDYSYTRLQNLIQVTSGRYVNSADRGINSVEFLGKLYVQGGHRLELGYTWMRIDTADKGRVRTMPEHWFNVLGVFNVVDDKLQVSTGLQVLGAMEDANRIVEYRDVHYCRPEEVGCLPGEIVNDVDPSTPWVTTQPTEVVLDRLPPTGELTLGITWRATDRVTVEGSVYNALNGRFYQPDLFADYEPRLEFMPNPYQDLRAFLGARYTY
jgi:outer membrane receptor protein involved in Fe transport